MRHLLSRHWWVIVAALFFVAAAVWLEVGSRDSVPLITKIEDPETASVTLAGGDNLPALLPSQTSVPTTAPASQKTVSARAYLVSPLAQNAKPLLSKKAEARWPLASLTKLMTAAIALQHTTPDQLITAVDVPGSYTPSIKHIPAGATYRASDLLATMLVESSNEAAESFAAMYGRDAFLAEMNRQAKDWGLTHTYFDDPTGLSAGNQSTAEDVLSLAQHLYANYPEVFAITQRRQVAMTDTTGIAYTANTTNAFAGTAGFLGGKTGYTEEAQGNLVSLFLLRGSPTAYVVFGSADRFGDTRMLINQATTVTP